MSRTEPREARQDQIRRDFLIYDAITANMCVVFWEQRGLPAQANHFREVRDRMLAESLTIPPPRHTTI
jgi:hypothetical protein